MRIDEISYFFFFFFFFFFLSLLVFFFFFLQSITRKLACKLMFVYKVVQKEEGEKRK
jgi:hypothetical protein